MFQGGGGTEGSLAAATGSQTGTASFPELSNGGGPWPPEDGGHESSPIAAAGPSCDRPPVFFQVNMFYPGRRGG